MENVTLFKHFDLTLVIEEKYYSQETHIRGS